jgi:hypothetical protein
LAKKTLGPRTVTASLDQTGNNAGNFTAVFDPKTVGINWTQYEVYKIVVATPSTTTVSSWTIFIGINQYDGFQSAGTATWSDTTPMRVDSGESLYFYFKSQVAAKITIWTQVDLDIGKQT